MLVGLSRPFPKLGGMPRPSQPASGSHERFLADFERPECYHPPLELEDGAQGMFLETIGLFTEQLVLAAAWGLGAAAI